MHALWVFDNFGICPIMCAYLWKENNIELLKYWWVISKFANYACNIYWMIPVCGNEWLIFINMQEILIVVIVLIVY